MALMPSKIYSALLEYGTRPATKTCMVVQTFVLLGGTAALVRLLH